jgi:DNA-directed RNA polymerase specialized sigma24 family protein
MNKNDWLAKTFQNHRSHLKAVAYCMLGSTEEADDAVQEACLRSAGSAAACKGLINHSAP